jgi:hypothetical protein
MPLGEFVRTYQPRTSPTCRGRGLPERRVEGVLREEALLCAIVVEDATEDYEDMGAGAGRRRDLIMSRRSGLTLGAVVGLGVLVAACSSGAHSGTPPSTTVTTAQGTTPSASPTTIASGQPLPPTGLIAVQEYKPGNAGVFAAGVFENSSIAGVAPRINWKDVEPNVNQFNWQIIDQVFTQAAASRKFVVLTFVPGFGTPDWALQGVTSAAFAHQYGPETGEVGTLPMPWDQVYLSRWFAFLQDVADRYESNPALRMISADGPTSVSEEMSLPDVGSDIKQWTALGYTPEKYVAAWKESFDAYARIFPKQFISLALYPGLPIGHDGLRDVTQRTTTVKQILAEGLEYKERFALQGNGLVAASNGDNVYDLVRSNSGMIATGFELTTSATTNPGREGDAVSPVHALTLALQRGLQAHVDFLEIYQADVVNPAMQQVLGTTLTQLSH